MLQLKGNFQLQISIRKIAEDVKKIIYGIKSEIDQLGTKTAERISTGHIDKLMKAADEIKAQAEYANELSAERLKVMLRKEGNNIQELALDFYDRVLRQEEQMARDGDKYLGMKQKIAILTEMDFVAIQEAAFDHKTTRIAEDLMNVTTMNYYAEMTRIHELMNPALEKFMRDEFDDQIQSFAGAGTDEKALQETFEKLVYYIQERMTSYARALSKIAFEPSPEFDELYNNKLPALVNKFLFDSRSRKRMEQFQQYVMDKLQDLND